LYPERSFHRNELPVKWSGSIRRRLWTGKSHLARLVGDGKLGRRWSLRFGISGTICGGVLPGVMAKSRRKALFEDTDEISAMLKRTQIYPIIHIMTIKEETVEKYPDLAAKLIEAFAKRTGLRRNISRTAMPSATPKSGRFWLRSLCVCAHRP